MKQSREYSWSLRHTPKGPLVPYMDGFTRLLSTQGYTQASVHLYTRLVADFSGWLKQKNVTKEEIAIEHTECYLRHRACQRRPRKGDLAALRRLLDLLRVMWWRRTLATPRRCNSY
jgi:site-specific recombinase XerD